MRADGVLLGPVVLRPHSCLREPIQTPATWKQVWKLLDDFLGCVNGQKAKWQYRHRRREVQLQVSAHGRDWGCSEGLKVLLLVTSEALLMVL